MNIYKASKLGQEISTLRNLYDSLVSIETEYLTILENDDYAEYIFERVKNAIGNALVNIAKRKKDIRQKLLEKYLKVSDLEIWTNISRNKNIRFTLDEKLENILFTVQQVCDDGEILSWHDKISVDDHANIREYISNKYYNIDFFIYDKYKDEWRKQK